MLRFLFEIQKNRGNYYVLRLKNSVMLTILNFYPYICARIINKTH